MTNNKFINAEIPVSNSHEAEAAAKKAEELGYKKNPNYKIFENNNNYLTLFANGYIGFYTTRATTPNVIPLSEFLNQPQTETVTLDNGEKWRVKLIEKVPEEPITAEEYYDSHSGIGNVCAWMEAYAKYRLEFEREKQPQ